eukprot:TRINITY_DN3296_c0_g1_i1.p1 TRINITY_DN3296_c0_g1~~TRINITY_DN3296_c0_g1_i1.p1  ORF type:complete len:574 (+),score=170.61 TRINITY_DN3296_c0_g1_i1:81-1802(+)
MMDRAQAPPPGTSPPTWQRAIETVAEHHDKVVDANAQLLATLEREKARRQAAEQLAGGSSPAGRSASASASAYSLASTEASEVRSSAGGGRGKSRSLSPQGFAPGEFVFVEGLVQLKRLNNKVGKVLGTARERVLVEILKGEKVAMRPRNLSKIPAALAEQVAQLHYDLLVTEASPPRGEDPDLHGPDAQPSPPSPTFAGVPMVGSTGSARSPFQPVVGRRSPPAPLRSASPPSASTPPRRAPPPGGDHRRVWSPSQRPRVPSHELRGVSQEPQPPALRLPPPDGGSPGRGGWGGPPPGPTAYQYPPVYTAEAAGRDPLLGVAAARTPAPAPAPASSQLVDHALVVGHDTAAYAAESPSPLREATGRQQALTSFAGVVTGRGAAPRSQPPLPRPSEAPLGNSYYEHPRALRHVADVRARYNVLKRYYTALYHTVLKRYIRLRPMGLEGRWHVAGVEVTDARGVVPVLFSASCSVEQTGHLTEPAGSGWTAASPASCAWLRLSLPYQRRVGPRVVVSHYPAFLPPHQAAALYASCRPSIPTHIKVEGSANGTAFVHLGTVAVTPATAGCVEVVW